ncbi:MAG TPA: carbohydrate kinase [Clostridiales bacterium]|nr:carbohydrate kinase [Clostridiales bacterium]
MSDKKSSEKKYTIAGVGEILWDMLPSGKQLGGAPANFVYHASALGADAYIVSTVGNDNLGREIINKINIMGLSSRYIQINNNHPTGTVEVKLDNRGIPSYFIHENVAWDYIYSEKEESELLGKADAICFGTLGQRSETSRNTILKMLENAREASKAEDPENVENAESQCIRVFDINLRQHFYNKEIIHNSLKHADIFKLNDEELPVVSKLLGLGHEICEEDKNSTLNILWKLAEKYSLKLIALTRGSKGSLLLSEGRVSDHPGFPADIVDTVGAGDAFTAAVIMGFLKKLDLDEINCLANRIGSYVCTREGGTPKLPEELVKRIKQ